MVVTAGALHVGPSCSPICFAHCCKYAFAYLPALPLGDSLLWPILWLYGNDHKSENLPQPHNIKALNYAAQLHHNCHYALGNYLEFNFNTSHLCVGSVDLTLFTSDWGMRWVCRRQRSNMYCIIAGSLRCVFPPYSCIQWSKRIKSGKRPLTRDTVNVPKMSPITVQAPKCKKKLYWYPFSTVYDVAVTRKKIAMLKFFAMVVLIPPLFESNEFWGWQVCIWLW